MVKAQEWLDKKYPQKNEVTISFIKNETVDKIKYEELEGDLEIKDYSNLERILLNSAKGISKISIENCPNIKVIIVNDNQITEIKGLDSLTNLRKLNFGDNKIEKIDVIKNVNLKSLIFYGNPKNLQFVNGIKNLTESVFLNTNDTFPITTLLEKASENDLKEVAEKLNLLVEGKSRDEIKKEIIAEIEKNNQNKEKLTELSKDLFDREGKINESELAKIKDETGKGREYQKLVDEEINNPIKGEDKSKIDQAKLTALLKELEQVHKNAEILDDGHFSQTKLDEILRNLKNFSEEAKNTLAKLGVDNLKEALEAKLGGSKLSDIPTNLKDLIEKVKNLEDIIKKAGIDPSSPDAVQKIEELKNRPTKDDLSNAVKNAEDKFKDYIDPNDKGKIETAARGQGMVSKSELDQANGKVKDYEEGLKNSLGLNDSSLSSWKDKISELKNRPAADQINSALGLGPNDPLPSDWKDKLDKIKSELDNWKNTFGKDKTPADVKKELDSRPATGGGNSGTGTALPDDYVTMVAYFIKSQGKSNWKNYINEWKGKNGYDIEKAKQYLAQIEQRPK